jgi:hypothetical protein
VIPTVSRGAALRDGLQLGIFFKVQLREGNSLAFKSVVALQLIRFFLKLCG